MQKAPPGPTMAIRSRIFSREPDQYFSVKSGFSMTWKQEEPEALPERYQSRTIRANSVDAGRGKEANLPQTRLVRRFLCDSVFA